MAYYQLTIENDKLSLTKNRKGAIINTIIIGALMIAVPIIVFISKRLEEPHPKIEREGVFTMVIFSILFLDQQLFM